MTCPRSTPGLIDRPMSISKSTRGTRSSPVKRSIKHLGDRGSLRVIKKRRALPGFAIEIDARRRVEAARTQIDALAARLGTKLAERNPHLRPPAVEHMLVAKLARASSMAMMPGSQSASRPAANRRNRRLIASASPHRRRAVEVGAGRRRRRRRVVVLLRARRHQHDAARRRGQTRRPPAAGSSRSRPGPSRSRRSKLAPCRPCRCSPARCPGSETWS